ncbi:MAG: hypothetical protein VXV91_08615, partial [Verrucomicrobiota bacterium]|nr:hypothetical protein [Verrucomicrobiota bacterium]
PGSIAHQLPFAEFGHLIFMEMAGGLGNGLLLVDLTISVKSLSRPMPQSSFVSRCIFFCTRPPSCIPYDKDCSGQTSPVDHKCCKKYHAQK